MGQTLRIDGKLTGRDEPSCLCVFEFSRPWTRTVQYKPARDLGFMRSSASDRTSSRSVWLLRIKRSNCARAFRSEPPRTRRRALMRDRSWSFSARPTRNSMRTCRLAGSPDAVISRILRRTSNSVSICPSAVVSHMKLLRQSNSKDASLHPLPHSLTAFASDIDGGFLTDREIFAKIVMSFCGRFCEFVSLRNVIQACLRGLRSWG